MHMLVIKRTDCRQTPFAGEVVAARFQFETALRPSEHEGQIAPLLYDLAALDLSQLDRHTQTLLDQQQDSRHLPMIALVPKDALIAHGLTGWPHHKSLFPHAIAMPRLAARIHSMLDHMDRPSSKTYRAGSLTVSPDTGQATFAGKPLALSWREITALTLLVRHAPNAVPRETLQTRIYGSAGAVTSNAIEAVLSRLRRALKKADCPVGIVALRGVGWRLRALDDSSEGQR